MLMDDDAWRIREQPEDEVQLMLARISHVAHRQAPALSRVPTCGIPLGGRRRVRVTCMKEARNSDLNFFFSQGEKEKITRA